MTLQLVIEESLGWIQPVIERDSNGDEMYCESNFSPLLKRTEQKCRTVSKVTIQIHKMAMTFGFESGEVDQE